jgi:hypothetical protein
MKFVLGLLFIGLSALADQAPDNAQAKPTVIQEGPLAQAYIQTAIYDYLDKPPPRLTSPQIRPRGTALLPLVRIGES